ncbi:hypothetical protein [Xenorhabdus hominickii]|uniref:hypothetical protein n=1 Tax=Xenorhabdus hominickii TaxID=351679 RepID=UPI0014767810|nr:hypothetical protein [Xenorhabdus hominickii]
MSILLYKGKKANIAVGETEAIIMRAAKSKRIDKNTHKRVKATGCQISGGKA